MTEEPIKVFFSYSHRDEEFKDELVKHLSILQLQGVVSGWHDRMIAPGSNWEQQIDRNLETADIILLLISSDFLASSYCWGNEMKKALRRHEAGKACVIPVVLRYVDWHEALISKLQALPKNAKPIASWNDRDEAFYDVVKGIKVAIENLRQAQKKQREEEQQAAEKARLAAEVQRRQEERQQAAERARLEAEERKQRQAERQAELRRQAAEQARLETEERKRWAEEWQAKLQQQIEERKRIRTEEQKQQEEKRREAEEQFRQNVKTLQRKVEKLAKQTTELLFTHRRPILRCGFLVIVLLAGGGGSIWLSSFKPFTQEVEFCKKQAETCRAIWLSSAKASDFDKRGDFRKEQGNLEGAISDYDQAIKLDPTYFLSFYSRGKIRSDLGNQQAAINDYTKAIEAIKTDSFFAAYFLGRIYNDRGVARSKLNLLGSSDRKDEINDYTEAIKHNSNFADPYYNRGLIYQKQKQSSLAISDFQKAADLSQNRWDQVLHQKALDRIAEVQAQSPQPLLQNDGIDWDPNFLKDWKPK